jgi:hypothetical protein
MSKQHLIFALLACAAMLAPNEVPAEQTVGVPSSVVSAPAGLAAFLVNFTDFPGQTNPIVRITSPLTPALAGLAEGGTLENQGMPDGVMNVVRQLVSQKHGEHAYTKRMVGYWIRRAGPNQFDMLVALNDVIEPARNSYPIVPPVDIEQMVLLGHTPDGDVRYIAGLGVHVTIHGKSPMPSCARFPQRMSWFVAHDRMHLKYPLLSYNLVPMSEFLVLVRVLVNLPITITPDGAVHYRTGGLEIADYRSVHYGPDGQPPVNYVVDPQTTLSDLLLAMFERGVLAPLPA